MSEGIKEKLEELYKKIPSFECLPGCTDCCGPVPLMGLEADQLGVPGTYITPFNLDASCKFECSNGCSKYENRPFMCRLFGTVSTPILTCPHGKGPEKPLTQEEGLKLTHEYKELFNEWPLNHLS